ncbi:MAG: DUF1330 domain-containing protein [Nodosilinea sp.]
MKKHTTAVMVALAIATSLLSLSPPAAIGTHDATKAEEAKAVYLMASLAVQDFESYMATYGAPVLPMLLAAGGEILVGAPAVEVLEGDYSSNWTVVVRFPSEQAARGWYDSAEYRALIPVRQSLTDQTVSTLVLAPQFQLPEP